ncbi:MAG: hypothetical protein ABIF40_04015 [archaeon]
MKRILSPSLLGYEDQLDEKLSFILDMIEVGIVNMHIDVMAPPFISDTNKFSLEKFKFLYGKLKGKCSFDIHFMLSNPIPYIESLDFIENKNKIILTIHMESFRTFSGGLERFNSKDYDLIKSDNVRLRQADLEIKNKIVKTLEMIKGKGFKTGIALEPGTSLENLTPLVMENVDLVLLMSVVSGAGGQKYHDYVTEKIKNVKNNFPSVIVQVDGGVNEETLPIVIEAGADNIVIGSYITNEEDVKGRVKEILNLL